MTGTVAHIFTAPAPGAPMQNRTRATLVCGQGIEGDRHFGRDTGDEPDELTLIEEEQIQHFAQATGLKVTGADIRRNVVTRGVDLNALVGQRFRVGAVTVEGVELCEPCAKLAAHLATEAVSAAMVVKTLTHRGGLRARIIDDGEVHVADVVG